MEKLFIIGAEICAFLLSLLCIYHYIAGNSDLFSVFYALMFAFLGYWCHRIQKEIGVL